MRNEARFEDEERKEREEKRGMGGDRETKNRRTAGELKIFEVALKIRRTHRCSREVHVYVYMRG